MLLFINGLKNFGTLFKEISEKYMPKNINSSNEWHVNKTVIKISNKRYYICTLIDSETRFIIDQFLIPSIKTTSALHIFTKVKDNFGSPLNINFKQTSQLYNIN